MIHILISACLIGENCKWDGTNNRNQGVLEFMKKMEGKAEFHPVCPEQLGGLPTPRAPSERQGSRIVMRTGADVTDAYTRGAQQTLALAQRFGCTAALLKQRSPSCGCGEIYDGTFTGTLTPGDGVTAALLSAHGVRVYGEDDVAELLNL